MKDNWKELTIGDEINLLGGFPFSSSNFNEEGVGTPLIRIRDLLNSSQETFYSGSFSNSYLINEQDILIGMDGDFHIVKWKNSPSLLNQRILKVSGKKESELEIDYLFYYLHPFLLDVHAKTAATTVKHLSTFDISTAVDIFPPLPQQRKIAKILSTCDEVIEKTEAAIAKYEALKQGMMHDLFTRGIDVNTGKLRASYQDAPELYKESDLGMIPMDWEVKTFGEILKITTGNKDTQDKVENGKYPFYVRSQQVERINTYSFEGIGILTAGDGVGTGKVFHFVSGRIDFHQRVYLLFDFKHSIVPGYVFEFFKLNFIHRVEKFSAKNTVDSVRLDMISEMLIPISKEQERISKILNNINKKIQTEQSALAKYQQLKAGLMQDLLTGNVEVSVAEEILKN
jgi:type I restriction enzyme, S subunit